jgi:hypothetical protein
MFYIIAAISGFLLAVFLFSYDDIKRNYQKKKANKKYNKLSNGVPKHVVFITCWDDAFKYRNYPLYVNGKVLGVDNFQWWHCNDEYKYLVDSEGEKQGCLIRQIARSERKENGKWSHKWGLAISTGPSFTGQIIKPSVVIEVY